MHSAAADHSSDGGGVSGYRAHSGKVCKFILRKSNLLARIYTPSSTHSSSTIILSLLATGFSQRKLNRICPYHTHPVQLISSGMDIYLLKPYLPDPSVLYDHQTVSRRNNTSINSLLAVSIHQGERFKFACFSQLRRQRQGEHKEVDQTKSHITLLIPQKKRKRKAQKGY